MIDSLVNLLFRCPHRNTTFPLTRAGKDRNGPAEIYVVCLDCGKQFSYDWEQMRLQKPVDISAGSRQKKPEATRVPFAVKSKAKYLVWASLLPAAAWLIGSSAAKSRKPSKDQPPEPKA